MFQTTIVISSTNKNNPTVHETLATKHAQKYGNAVAANVFGEKVSTIKLWRTQKKLRNMDPANFTMAFSSEIPHYCFAHSLYQSTHYLKKPIVNNKQQQPEQQPEQQEPEQFARSILNRPSTYCRAGTLYDKKNNRCRRIQK